MAAEAMTVRQLGRGLKSGDFVVKVTLAYGCVVAVAIIGSGTGLGALILGMLSAAPVAFFADRYREKMNDEWRHAFERNLGDLEARSETD